MKQENKKNYHHGALKDALAEYALQHIRLTGWQMFSMREAAREIGVSPGAAYKHFKTVDDLLFEVSQQGFAMLDAAMQEARKHCVEAHAALVNVGLAYINFAKDELHLFNLMFSDKTARLFKDKYRGECKATDSKALVAAMLDYTGRASMSDIQLYCDFFWVLVHGAASLEATSGWQRNDDEKRAIVEMGMDVLEKQREIGALSCL